MFWRMAGLSTASPVETILDKDNFTLEELLDEDEIIQECKALNGRLINFLRERPQVEQLLRYIVEEAPEDAEKRRTFKFPFVACEIFTCEVDIILRTLVEEEELMNLLFSFLEPDHPHSTLLAGYFSKVVICLLLRKTAPLMHYIQVHQEIFPRLIDLIGITSIMEVLIRLIGADEHMYTNYSEAMQWLEDTNVLEMIVDKFRSSECPEVHANAAETLCAITRSAPPDLTAKISSPGFVGRLFRHALEVSRPKSVLVNSLSVCISLLDPKRLSLGPFHSYNRQLTPPTTVTANPETVDGMLESLGGLLKLLDVSSAETALFTTYGKLQPPLGKHRLKIIEFVSVLLSIGSETAEKELIRLGAVQRIFDLFVEYPFNNFLHHYVESIIISCLESKNNAVVNHALHDCNLVGRILEAEKSFLLDSDQNKPTVPVEGRSPPRIGIIGHLTRIANKLAQLGNSNSAIQSHLQGNSEWVDWHNNVLLKRNTVENVYQWACGRPTALHDRGRDSDDDDYQDRDYDVAALANNLSQAFRYGIYSNDDIEETHGSLDRDDEDVYFDDESAEVVISSLRLGDDQESGSLFTNSNWFAFEDDRTANERSTGQLASPSPNSDELPGTNTSGEDEVIVGEDDDLVDTATSSVPETEPEVPAVESTEEIGTHESEAPPEWVEWRETSDTGHPSLEPATVPNGELEKESKDRADVEEPSQSSGEAMSENDRNSDVIKSKELAEGNSSPDVFENSDPTDNTPSLDHDFKDVKGVESASTAATNETDTKDAGSNETDIKDAGSNETDIKDAGSNETDIKDAVTDEADKGDTGANEIVTDDAGTPKDPGTQNVETSPDVRTGIPDMNDVETSTNDSIREPEMEDVDVATDLGTGKPDMKDVETSPETAPETASSKGTEIDSKGIDEHAG